MSPFRPANDEGVIRPLAFNPATVAAFPDPARPPILERGLRERLDREPDLFSLERRLVLVRGEGHRCKGTAALAALLAAVEVLPGQPLAPEPRLA
jgi:hypothetical protein